MSELDGPFPGVPPAEGESPGLTQRRRWLGIVEALVCLVACLVTALSVGGLELLLLAPETHELEFRLYTGDRSPDEAAADELVGRVETLDLADSVSLVERGATTALVLRGVEDPESVRAAVENLLAESGYRRFEPDVRSVPDPESLLRDHPALTLGLQAAVLIVFGVALARLRVRPESLKAKVPRSLAIGAAAGLLGFASALLVSGIQYLLGWSIEEQTWLLELLRDRETLLRVLPFVVLVMPVSEEALFRGYLFRFLLQRAGGMTAYVVSAAAFSAVHLHLPGVPTYFIVGLLFAWVCRRTGSLVAPVAGHVTYNGLALGLSLVAPAAARVCLPASLQAMASLLPT